MNIDLQKIIFWDYSIDAIERLPVETVAQRLVDRWAVIDSALCNKKLTKPELIEILTRIAAFSGVVYCESVREFVIKELIKKYV